MLAATVRTALVVVGALTAIAGLLLLATFDVVSGLWTTLVGAFLLIAGLIEHRRYRSAATEGSAAPTGPGGGESRDAAIERRFQSTAEVFVDPTTGHRMRVLVDPATGERRYRAEA